MLNVGYEREFMHIFQSFKHICTYLAWKRQNWWSALGCSLLLVKLIRLKSGLGMWWCGKRIYRYIIMYEQSISNTTHMYDDDIYSCSLRTFISYTKRIEAKLKSYIVSWAGYKKKCISPSFGIQIGKPSSESKTLVPTIIRPPFRNSVSTPVSSLHFYYLNINLQSNTIMQIRVNSVYQWDIFQLETCGWYITRHWWIHVPVLRTIR